MTDQPFGLDGVLNDLAQKLVHDSRDWAVYRFDAWLYGIFVGWDCEKAHEHDETCDNGDAMQDVAGRHNWGPDTVARLRRARSSVRNASAMAAEIHRLRAQAREYGELAARRESELIALRAKLAREERAHGETIDDRDHFHDMADKLAYAVAPEEVIGEHSSMNCPWENALDLITPMAEVEKLREELERQTALAEQGARANRELSRLRAELAAVRTKVVVTEADEIVACCPDHGSRNTAWMHCHCDVADDMRRRAALPAAVEAHVVAHDSDDPEHVDDCPGGTRPCGHDDYHDPHEWADRPGTWCPGISYADDEASQP
ncbi:hypothetical protein [Streptomyces sp. F-1]|uniref:hypothetical protein n=1 Tax=Streptomyces sp. F-1 TaxID=463642 RepID=UPI00085CC56A|nr:hypothetical protein [Streptomyces sp. F-1]SFY52091.1 hypothetical protein STEPF1_05360 [Streptomyces sp. F-1]